MKKMILVDVGGGFGQAIEKLRKAYPFATGKFILQDLPKTIEAIFPDRAQELGFEPMAHNFFKPQPIHGAKYYHLRRILYDWNDQKCLEILKALSLAFEPGYSKLLVHDFILPDVGAGPIESTVDMLMMTACDGKERTAIKWLELLEKAGFKIETFHGADVGATAVIEASLA